MSNTKTRDRLLNDNDPNKSKRKLEKVSSHVDSRKSSTTSKIGDQESTKESLASVFRTRRGKLAKDDAKRIQMAHKNDKLSSVFSTSSTSSGTSLKTSEYRSEESKARLSNITYNSELSSQTSAYDLSQVNTNYKGIYVDKVTGKNLDMSTKTVNFKDVPEDIKEMSKSSYATTSGAGGKNKRRQANKKSTRAKRSDKSDISLMSSKFGQPQSSSSSQSQSASSQHSSSASGSSVSSAPSSSSSSSSTSSSATSSTAESPERSSAGWPWS